MSEEKICIKCEECGFIRELKGETKPIKNGFITGYGQEILEGILKKNLQNHRVHALNVDASIM